MTPNDRQKFAAIVTGFAELKGKQLSHAALDLFWAAMQRWTIEDFQAAAAHLVGTCEFMPTPKDFEDLRKAGRASVAEAWSAVLQHVRSSSYRNGGIGDATIDAAVHGLGGYRAIAMHDEETLHFLERRFAEHYEDAQDREDTRAAVPEIAADRKFLARARMLSHILGRD